MEAACVWCPWFLHEDLGRSEEAIHTLIHDFLWAPLREEVVGGCKVVFSQPNENKGSINDFILIGLGTEALGTNTRGYCQGHIHIPL